MKDERGDSHCYFGLREFLRADVRDSFGSGDLAEALILSVDFDARLFAGLIAASQCLMYLLAGTRLIASPISSSARSSTFLNRRQAFPMSSFLPVRAHACRNHSA